MTPNAIASAAAKAVGETVARLRREYGDVAFFAMAKQTGGDVEWLLAVERLAAVPAEEMAEFVMHPADWVTVARVADPADRRRIITEFLATPYTCYGLARAVDEHLEKTRS